ncbi:MAG: hypothetical protein FK734_16820 [Asgard group archaeon]|nr:hypothetical protein [Asgard group archaeon]
MTIAFEIQMIHRRDGVQLFSYRFSDFSQQDPTLISGLISAVNSFAEELKPSQGREIIKFVDRGDFVLQAEPGNYVIGLLILSCKDYSYRNKLKILVNEFEKTYEEDLREFNGFLNFNDFEVKVKQLISSKPISPYHIPEIVRSDRGPQNLDDMKWAIFTRINGENSINSISEDLDISVDIVQSIIAYFEESGLVKTHFRITDNSVVELTKKGLIALEKDNANYDELINSFGEGSYQLLTTIGTERTISDIKAETNMDDNRICDIIENLVSTRYLEVLPTWKLDLDKKAFQFTRSLEFISDLFQLIYDETDNWLGIRELERVKNDTAAYLRIKHDELARLVSDNSEYFIDRSNLKKFLSDFTDIKNISDLLEPLFRALQLFIEKEIGSNLTKDITRRVLNRLKLDYSELITEQKELKPLLNWLQ